MMEVDNTAVADDRSRRDTSVLSMDDLEAAQALEGLRTGAFPLFIPPLGFAVYNIQRSLTG
jgi:hypothetical protein